MGGHDGRAREHEAVRGAARRQGDPARARPVGVRRAARLARVAGAAGASPAAVLLSRAPRGRVHSGRAGLGAAPHPGWGLCPPATRGERIHEMRTDVSRTCADFAPIRPQPARSDTAAQSTAANAQRQWKDAEAVASEHLIGLLLGTEEDWPGAFEAIVGRLGDISYRGETHRLVTERVTNEPFDLRSRPRYGLVIDRLAWWYHVPREWLKKISLMDDVYLLNNPFTFQAMEKHSAYCAMMRLGMKVPETWLVPHKVPPDNPRFLPMAERYNPSFELGAIGDQVGYPLFMKPFDGGQWVGVTRVRDAKELHQRYDESGERLMHLQAAVEDFDVFARSLSIGAETMVMRFEPDRPMHDRYEVSHDFLSPELGAEIVTISKVVNAFFRWEFNSCETIVKGGEAFPIDYANASPDVALTSLHYYFPWAIAALV